VSRLDVTEEETVRIFAAAVASAGDVDLLINAAGIDARALGAAAKRRHVHVRLDQIVIDALDPARLARFWAALLGGDAVDRDHGWSEVRAPKLPRVSFQPVTDARHGKNRLHLDLEVDDISTAAAEATRFGATRVGTILSGHLGRCQVMNDPEGNEFCFVQD
jgi:predicted enzyme related to lactoylglutathione lyase